MLDRLNAERTMTQPAADAKHLVYIADPMCSWCYGFAPAIETIAAHFGPRLPIKLLMGGLRPGVVEPMRDKDREYIRGAWANVHAASGQPFDAAFFERKGFVYDTEPSCRAVVVYRHMQPEDALAFMHRLQTAFYAHNRDITDTGVLSDIAAEAGADRNEFEATFRSAHAINATLQDFSVAIDAGIRGFPTLIAGTQADGYQIVTHGFAPLDGIRETLEQWLAAEHSA
jgi:putative protein-disulfide isomerase